MYSLSNIEKCRRAATREIATERELLSGVQTLGDRADSILYNAKLIAQNKKALAEGSAKTPLTKKKQEDIDNCSRTIKEHLVKLGADDNSITEIFACVETDDMELLRYNLLKVLVKRNPGMYSRKLTMAARGIAQRQH